MSGPADPEQDDEEARPLLRDDVSRRYFKAVAPIALRDKPRIDAERTSRVLKLGEVVQAQDIVTLRSDGSRVQWDHAPLDEACFVLVGEGEGRGWALSRNLITEDILLEPVQGPDGQRQGVRATLYHVLQTSAFEYCIIAVVLLNAVAIGCEIDYSDRISKTSWKVINYSFLGIYVLEIGLKMFAFGVRTFFESTWNIFDFVVTAVTVLGDVLPLFLESVPIVGAIAPVLRLLRLLRLARIFRDIRTLLRSFASSLGALCWIGVFTVLWFYICACICTVFIGSPKWMKDGEVPEAPELRAKFRTIPYSMYSLFEVMTLEGAPDVLRPLVEHKPGLVAFFALFIFVAAFFLLNLVTAVVVDSTVASQQQDRSSKEASEEDDSGRITYELRDYFTKKNSAEQCQDIVQREKLVSWLDDKFVKKALVELGWDRGVVEGACSVLDKDLSGKLSITELCMWLKGTSRPLDTYALFRMQAEMTARVEQQERALKQVMDMLERMAAKR